MAKVFEIVVILIEVLIILFFGLFVQYDPDLSYYGSDNDAVNEAAAATYVGKHYPFF